MQVLKLNEIIEGTESKDMRTESEELNQNASKLNNKKTPRRVE